MVYQGLTCIFFHVAHMHGSVTITDLHLGDFNYNWFDSKGPKSCNYRPGLTSISKLDERYGGYYTKGYFEPKYIGAAQYDYCQVPFYFPQSNRTMR